MINRGKGRYVVKRKNCSAEVSVLRLSRAAASFAGGTLGVHTRSPPGSSEEGDRGCTNVVRTSTGRLWDVVCCLGKNAARPLTVLTPDVMSNRT